MINDEWERIQCMIGKAPYEIMGERLNETSEKIDQEFGTVTSTKLFKKNKQPSRTTYRETLMNQKLYKKKRSLAKSITRQTY